jgi:Uma2 family endonuclease
MEPARKLATYADLRALPEDARFEILDGALVAQAGALPRHSNVQGELARQIGGPYHGDGTHGGPGGWWILLDVDVELSLHQVVRPDVAGWRRERLPDPWDMRPINVVPDWICEVLSPSNAAHDRVKKLRLYAQAGVSFYWMIDPAERTLEALRLGESGWVSFSAYDDESTAQIAPFDAVELEVGRLFPPR